MNEEDNDDRLQIISEEVKRIAKEWISKEGVHGWSGGEITGRSSAFKIYTKIFISKR